MKSPRRASFARVTRIPLRSTSPRYRTVETITAFPVDSAMDRWKARSSSAPSPPTATAASIAAKA